MKLSDISETLTGEQLLIARIVKESSSTIKSVAWNNGKLDIVGMFNLRNLTDLQLDSFIKDNELRVPFGKIIGDFSCENYDLKSFKNFPTHVAGLVNCDGNDISNFNNCTSVINTTLSIRSNYFSSFHNIHKNIKSLQLINISTHRIKDSILGLLLIENFNCVIDTGKLISQPFKILNRYTKAGRGKEALFECQQELIDAGYEEYAKL